jgi:arsenate reductase
MAEAILRHELGNQVRALSAGTRPQPKVADGAIAALKLAHLPTEGLYAKDISAVPAVREALGVKTEISAASGDR